MGLLRPCRVAAMVPAWPSCGLLMNVPLVHEEPAAKAGCDPLAPNDASMMGSGTSPGRPRFRKTADSGSLVNGEILLRLSATVT